MSTKDVTEATDGTWFDAKQTLNNLNFCGFNSRAEEIGNLAKTICELNEEVPHLYLRMRIFGNNHIEVFACDTSTEKQFEKNNFLTYGTSFIDFYHFVALVINAKKAVSNEGN